MAWSTTPYLMYLTFVPSTKFHLRGKNTSTLHILCHKLNTRKSTSFIRLRIENVGSAFKAYMDVRKWKSSVSRAEGSSEALLQSNATWVNEKEQCWGIWNKRSCQQGEQTSFKFRPKLSASFKRRKKVNQPESGRQRRGWGREGQKKSTTKIVVQGKGGERSNAELRKAPCGLLLASFTSTEAILNASEEKKIHLPSAAEIINQVMGAITTLTVA